MKNISFLRLCFAFLFICCQSAKIYDKQLIIEDWKVFVNDCPANSMAPRQNYVLQTSLPTTLHLDLLSHKKIQDPYFGSNYQSQKWISQCNAIYRKNLTITQEMLEYQIINIVFEGIDTYSTVKLNSKEILKTKNAFVQYKYNAKNDLNIGINLLEVQIKSTKTFDDIGQSKNHMPYPYAHTRKACYQYSWDWAPFMNTLGIWKDAYLQFYDQISIDYVWIQLQKLQQKEALLNFAIKLRSSQEAIDFSKYQLIIVNRKKQSQQLGKIQVQGTLNYAVVKINQPKLWWPNGIGEPFVYDFRVKLIYGQNQTHFKNVPYGIRTVRLDQTNNAFTVIINGYRVYCKGANYVPPDMMYPRLINKKYKNENSIQKLLHDAVKSNFNMIRIWGGGQYQSNQLYQTASRLGIMLFYDFMFSDSIYPSDIQFLGNVQVEIVQQVRRVRNYPALTLWSGNNQILQGIQSWGWGSQKFKDDYKKLFDQFIRQIVQNQSPQIPYIASSPVNGVGNSGFQRGGDVHYWGVWAAGSGFQSYQNAVGPFNSQFGTQSLPVWETVVQFTNQSGRTYDSGQLLSHQRHGSQFSTLRKYINEYARESLNFQLQTYQSGLVQAYGIQIAIKAQRASKNNKSMGTLYWQFNDAWPAISWSSIDYFGRWKPLQYKAKLFYQNLIAFYEHKSGKVISINDYLNDINFFIEVKVISFSGQVYKQMSMTASLRQNEAKYLFELQKQEIDANSTKVVVSTKIILDTNRTILVPIFVKPLKYLDLPKCQLQVHIEEESNQIDLAAECLIKSLHIYHSQKYLQLSDNYIDIIPGQIHRVIFIEGNLKQIKQQLKFKSYYQVYNKEELVVLYK